ncbi:hypothetical protein [Bacillus sp. ISL-46]|uniref:hypothetical protein n=1 Tax=Bacillus sp. ISL-46 TaxID=2819129 RepID=UPI001BE639BE|nr:hypothetical protein [Bacillus sp. ISL-46]MBT2719864.1 hypothetical protein [Bacillus sp. ISL-46]
MSWIPSFLKTKFSLSISTVGTILAFNAVGGTLALAIVVCSLITLAVITEK